ncbi:MAG: hypothetical protein UW37_C0006G0015 [Candidatus Gottesmanbacteria bacterium GW2011_GWA2_44_17]|uniref:Uncharacterized protein n=1 Tax=Candidatus Gottesmanbacteria bacterium GW2011_GWA2_44_17 TaxID=1618444 RepID=A0A0G1JUE8_9BACT|nr:MAG: hypothetical protein UV46_C0071G0002 [Candidatus Gottesmanbacteria bacterium GW2011_GWC2_42_8]KKT47552.1 MAG: hypothetical protein UW37_C0006G0015 [Candidatus Gottesmanbacteria bacterium GW2011_GWA2_44_17]
MPNLGSFTVQVAIAYLLLIIAFILVWLLYSKNKPRKK